MRGSFIAKLQVLNLLAIINTCQMPCRPIEGFAKPLIDRNFQGYAKPSSTKGGEFAFMLYPEPEKEKSIVNYPDECQTIMVFNTADLEKVFKHLKSNNMVIVQKGKNILVFNDPFDNAIEAIGQAN